MSVSGEIMELMVVGAVEIEPKIVAVAIVLPTSPAIKLRGSKLSKPNRREKVRVRLGRNLGRKNITSSPAANRLDGVAQPVFDQNVRQSPPGLNEVGH